MAGDKMEALEVEVIEIDGIAPPPPAPAAERETRPRLHWQSWNGQIRKLDPRWWPLWLFLGLIALALLVVIGIGAGVITITCLIVRRLLFALIPSLAPPRTGAKN